MEAGERNWEILITEQAKNWLTSLDREDKARAIHAIDTLQERGPALRRPEVGVIKGSRHHNMKELIPAGGHLRVLFAFDAHRRGTVLLGGDKTNNWRGWYRQAIRGADRLQDEHLRGTSKERTWQAVRRDLGGR